MSTTFPDTRTERPSSGGAGSGRAGSAYPIAMDELIGKVRALAVEQREWPSRNQVMTEFRVGGPKARDALTALRATGFDPTPAEQPGEAEHGDAAPASTAPAPVPALRAVPNLADDTPARPGLTEHDHAPDAGAAERTPVDAATAAAGVESLPAPAGDRPAGFALVKRFVGPGTAPDTTAGTTADGESVPQVRRSVGVPRWPLVLIAAGAFVAIWGGWVGLGELTGFGPIRPLPGIWDGLVINSAITLPIGMEAYAAFALRAWLAPPDAGLTRTARRFACWSALGALALGAAGQIAYHLMVAAGMDRAPWQITAFVSCLPVIVLGCGAALTHLIHTPAREG